VADIDRGGVFASLVGTVQLLTEQERKRVKGVIVNQFRGDKKLFADGARLLADYTGVPVLGIIPYEYLSIPSEDSVSIDDKYSSGLLDVDIAVVRLPLISNFTDFEPLERAARVRYVPLDGDLGKPDLIILPGTKNTVNDLKALSASSLSGEIKALSAAGVPVIGICGGYQMLGRRITDHCIEGDCEETLKGLELLPVETVFDAYEKTTRQAVKR